VFLQELRKSTVLRKIAKANHLKAPLICLLPIFLIFQILGRQLFQFYKILKISLPTFNFTAYLDNQIIGIFGKAHIMISKISFCHPSVLPFDRKNNNKKMAIHVKLED